MRALQKLWLRAWLWWNNVCPEHGEMELVATPSGKGYHTCRECNFLAFQKKLKQRELRREYYNALD